MGERLNPNARRRRQNERVPTSQPTSPLEQSRPLTGNSTVLEGIAGVHQIGRNINAGINYWIDYSHGTVINALFRPGVDAIDNWWDETTDRASWPSWQEIRTQHYSGSMYGMGPSAATRESYRIMRTGTARESRNEAFRVNSGSLFRYGTRMAPWAYNFYTGRGPAAWAAERPRIETSIPNPRDPLSRAIPHVMPGTFTPEEQSGMTELGMSIYGMVSELVVPDPDGSSGASLIGIMANMPKDFDWDRAVNEAMLEEMTDDPMTVPQSPPRLTNSDPIYG